MTKPHIRPKRASRIVALVPAPRCDADLIEFARSLVSGFEDHEGFYLIAWDARGLYKDAFHAGRVLAPTLTTGLIVEAARRALATRLEVELVLSEEP